MTIVVCPELNYLDAKTRKARGGWHKWTQLEDAKLKEYTGYGVATDLIALELGMAEKCIRQRQRVLSLRCVSGRTYKR